MEVFGCFGYNVIVKFECDVVGGFFFDGNVEEDVVVSFFCFFGVVYGCYNWCFG